MRCDLSIGEDTTKKTHLKVVLSCSNGDAHMEERLKEIDSLLQQCKEFRLNINENAIWNMSILIACSRDRLSS